MLKSTMASEMASVKIPGTYGFHNQITHVLFFHVLDGYNCTYLSEQQWFRWEVLICWSMTLNATSDGDGSYKVPHAVNVTI